VEDWSGWGAVGERSITHTVKYKRNILPRIQQRKTNWTGHMSHMNCLLKQLNEGKIRGEDGSYGKQRKKT
jgi:hypothetical protein